jgi:hypothetical protein
MQGMAMGDNGQPGAYPMTTPDALLQQQYAQQQYQYAQMHLQGQQGAGGAPAFLSDGNGAYGLQVPHPHAAMYYQQQQAHQQLQLHVSLAPGAHKRPLSLELEPSYSA